MASTRKPPSPPHALLTSREAAELLRVHPKHLYRLLRRGLPGHRVGGEWRFVREELLSFSTGTPRAAAPTASPSVIAANGDLAIELLLTRAAERSGETLAFLQTDRDGALSMLSSGRALAAGAHGPGGATRLAGRSLARLDLVDRQVGLTFRRGKKVRGVEDLGSLRLASRPRTAGVRAHLDAALKAAGIDPAHPGFDSTELSSHREVVLSVLRREADVGLSSCAWARRAGLSFVPLATERYGLLLFAESLGDPRVIALGEVAQSGAYRRDLEAVEGYDVTHVGEVRFLAAG